MSYEILYIKKENLLLSEVEVILGNGNNYSDEYLVSEELVEKIKSKIKKEGIEFDEDANEERLIYSNTFEISLAVNLISVSLIYNENKVIEIQEQFSIVDKILSEFGFTGYDVQEERIYVKGDGVSKTFEENIMHVEEIYEEGNSNKRSSSNLKGRLCLSSNTRSNFILL